MPRDIPGISSFLRRDLFDRIMFGWVQCMQLNLPGVSIERALANFATHYGVKEFNVKSQKTRYLRMVDEFWEDKKTVEA